MKKKIFSLTLWFMCLCVMTFGTINASAETYEDITYVVNSYGEVVIKGCTETATSIRIPEEINGYPVTAIDAWAFYAYDNIESVRIPDSVTWLGYSSFAYCSNLERVRLGDGINVIQSNTFGYCPNLEDITLPENVTSIGDHAFQWCQGLRSIEMEGDITSIGDGAFLRCEELESITFPESLTSIGDSAFASCLSFENITIPGGVTTIGSYAFQGCVWLKDVVIEGGEHDLSIGDCAFAECEQLESILIPRNVTQIDDAAFSDSENVTIYGYLNSYAQEYANKNNIPFVVIDTRTPAEKLCDLINEQDPDSCTVDVKSQKVTLISDVELKETLEIPECLRITLDIGNFNIFGADDLDAIRISNEAELYLTGTGTIYGGNAVENLDGANAIYSNGTLTIFGPTLQGGDAIDENFYGGSGLNPSAFSTYFVEGEIIAGEGLSHQSIMFERLTLSVLKESDDGANYTPVMEHFANKKYIKAIKISSDLSAPQQLAAILNEIEAEACTLSGNQVTLNKDFVCPDMITVPSGDAIVLDFNGHTVTTGDFYSPFEVLENGNITMKGPGVLTNQERPTGYPVGIGAGASTVYNDGTLTVAGIRIIGVDLCGISNGGTLIVNSGSITGDAAKDAIVNRQGTITVNGGEIIGGDATVDGQDGGDGIGNRGISIGEPPIQLNGGIICGGKGLGDGEDAIAVDADIAIGENKVGYESTDGINYSVFEGARSYMRYLKVEPKVAVPEIGGGGGGNLGAPDTSGPISAKYVAFDGGEISFTIKIESEDTVSGTVYVAVYEEETFQKAMPVPAEVQIPMNFSCAKGATIKIFWWDETLEPMCSPAEIKAE